MTAIAAANSIIRIEALNYEKPILFAADRNNASIRAGTIVEIGDAVYRFADDTPVTMGGVEPGKDYAVRIDANGQPVAENVSAENPLTVEGYFAGFHFAPGGHAEGVAGGDSSPAINPYSFWNVGFQPTCPDPRGMALIEFVGGKPFWIDIYLTGSNYKEEGTSRYGVEIAHGSSLPRLDYKVATEICASHGKRLPTYDEFRTAAFGATERSSASKHPKKTGLDAARTSQFGLMQATGNLWIWGTDGHPNDPRPSVFGGSWFNGSDAGSRCARLDCWAGDSGGGVGLRAASDHMAPV